MEQVLVKENPRSDNSAPDAVGIVTSTDMETREAFFIAEPSGEILWVNRAFSRIAEPQCSGIVGRSMSLLWGYKPNAASYASLAFENVQKSLNETGQWKGQIWIKNPMMGARLRWLNLSSVYREGHLLFYVGLIFDAVPLGYGVMSQSEAQNRSLALPNRVYLLDRLGRWMTALNLKQGFGSIIALHLSDFNALRAAYGEGESELFVSHVVDRLVENLGDIDKLIRSSHDQLVILLDTPKRTREEVFVATRILCEHLIAQFQYPFDVYDQKRYCSVSAGIAVFGNREAKATELLREAEIAMVQSFDEGPNHFQFFDVSMQTELEAKIGLEQEMRLAVLQKELLLHYQPQVDKKGSLVGYEALMRWNHPVYGLMVPADFLNLSESNRLIIELGYWVIEEACNTLVGWSKTIERKPLRLSVNVSPLQFMEVGFVEQVISIVNKTGANPQRLRLEMIESILLEDLEKAVEIMNQLKTKGLTISLDDFGTGYSSMSYLRRLPIDEIKIPQTFVREVLHSNVDEGIIRAIISFAEALNIEVVAEGVESEAQWGFLKQLGCNVFQGYLFGKPQRLPDLP